MSDDVILRISEIAADIFGDDTHVVTGATTQQDLESWDSLAQLNLMAALEDEFGIEIDPEAMDSRTSIAAIAQLVAALR
jgi:acyl carrier protein